MSKSEKGEGISVVTAEDQLALFRKGNDQPLNIKYGDFEIPVRLMSASEFAVIVAEAKAGVKVPHVDAKESFESLAMMKSIINKATTIKGIPKLAGKFLDMLTSSELEIFYDQYIDIIQKVDPLFEDMDLDKVAALIMEAKKKDLTARDFTTCQLVAIGKYFLEKVLPTVNGLGG